MLRSTLFVLLVTCSLFARPALAQTDDAPAAESSVAATPTTSLPPRQERMLREGRGMGLARAGELNGYPGPMHVLQQADSLELTDDQRAATARLMARVREKAPALGQQIIDAEAELNAMFAENRVTEEAMRETLATIAELSAELRAVHLNAHIEQAEILTDAQKAAYQPAHSMHGGERRRMRQRTGDRGQDEG